MQHNAEKKGGKKIRKPKTINTKQSEELIKLVPYQTQLILRLGVESGMRISDILGITADKIDKKMTVYETKSKQERTFEISDELHQDLKKYCGCNLNGCIVFKSGRRGAKRVSRVTIHRHIKKALKTLNFEASAHSTRKLYAQNILNTTGSIEEVKKSLNHRNILTTATYLDINLESLIKSLANKI